MDKMPNMNDKNNRKLLEQIKRLSASYIPQWRFDEENPDMGTALAIIFAAMQCDTLNMYNELPLKWCTEYFNNLHASLLSEQPAFGYVTLGLVNEEVRGTELPAGTRLTVDKTDNAGNAIPVETRDNVFVAPSHLVSIYESYDKLDYIGKLWDENDSNSFCIFGFDGENIQRHAFFISHSYIFAMSKGGEVKIEFYSPGGKPLSEETLGIIGGNGKFYYSSDDGFIQFEKYYRKGNTFVFVKSALQPPWTEFEIDGVRQYWIKYEADKGTPFYNMSLGSLRLKSNGAMLSPQAVYAAGTDVDSRNLYFPFGEQLSLYEEVYFSCDEVFSKKGSLVTMSFMLDFAKIPLNITDKEGIDWRLIMPKSAVKIEPEYDVTISKVVWEYFNGNGWARLFNDDRYDGVFNAEHGVGRRKKTLHFICPDDMSPAIINSAESRCIRARIIRLNNGFKTNGQYVSPMLSETYFSYDYDEFGVTPEFIYEQNNGVGMLKRAKDCFNGLRGYDPIHMAGDKIPTVYFCLSSPLINGPIRILALLGKPSLLRKPVLKWQYFGSGKWRSLNVADETKNFENSGIISFNGTPDFEKTECFGKSGYWIRVQDVLSGYDDAGKDKLPLIEGLYINSVKAWTIRTNVEEYLTFEDFNSSTEFRLINRRIYSEQVWINETGKLSKGEEEFLEKDGRMRRVIKNTSEVQTWVLWERTESFYDYPGDGRKYIIDRGNGIIKFSSAANYRLPPPGVANGIYLNLSIGGGEEGNLEKGSVNGTELNYGYINSVQNYVGFSGGCGRENSDEAIRRTAAEYKHHFRAVTADDYEKLACEASRMVCRAFCFIGKAADGRRKSGHITLVILQKDYEKSSYYFHSLKNIIIEYLKDKVFDNLISQNRLHIVPPDFIEIQVGADIKVSDFNEIFNCKNEVLNCLKKFLDPISGNFTGSGFEAGMLPDRGKIETVIKTVPSVKEIRNLIVLGTMFRGGEKIEINPEEMWQYPYAIPINGKHRIFVRTE